MDVREQLGLARAEMRSPMLGVNNHCIQITRRQRGGGWGETAGGYGELKLLRMTRVMLSRREKLGVTGRGRGARRIGRLYHVTWKLDSRGVKVPGPRGKDRWTEEVTCDMGQSS